MNSIFAGSKDLKDSTVKMTGLPSLSLSSPFKSPDSSPLKSPWPLPLPISTNANVNSPAQSSLLFHHLLFLLYKWLISWKGLEAIRPILSTGLSHIFNSNLILDHVTILYLSQHQQCFKQRQMLHTSISPAIAYLPKNLLLHVILHQHGSNYLGSDHIDKSSLLSVKSVTDQYHSMRNESKTACLFWVLDTPRSQTQG